MLEDEQFIAATRQTGKDAKGHNKRIGKGKRSSHENYKVIQKDNSKKSSNADDENQLLSANSLPGALKCFKDQKTGSVGIRKKLILQANDKSIDITYDDYELYHNKIQHFLNPNTNNFNNLLKTYLSNGNEWLWKLSCNFNLLLFGIGSKINLIKKFALRYLDGEDVLEIDGSSRSALGVSYNNDRILRGLLNVISVHILKNNDLPNCSINIINYTKLITGISYISIIS